LTLKPPDPTIEGRRALAATALSRRFSLNARSAATVTTIQRINTGDGLTRGRCEQAASLLVAPHRIDEVFLRPAD
jgi:hypothetical protein